MSTIYDIAKKVGVSTATVSNAFNRPEQMKPETRQRILAVAEKLGYQPNVNAKALAGGRSQLVAILVSDIRTPIVANVTRGLEGKLLDAELIPVIASTDGDSTKTLNMLAQLQRHGASGYIMVPAQYGVPDPILEKLVNLQSGGVPVVVAGYDASTEVVSYVAIRGQKAAHDLTLHMINLGHREIAFIGSHFSQGHALQRWLGFQEALYQKQIPLRPELVIEANPTPNHAFQAMEQLMALPVPPTAVIAASDIYAIGIIDYTNLHNIKLPDQLSIGTFDFSTLVQRVTPSITSIVASAYKIGQLSADLFLDLRTNPTKPPQQTYLNYQLHIRDTSAPPQPTYITS